MKQILILSLLLFSSDMIFPEIISKERYRACMDGRKASLESCKYMDQNKINLFKDTYHKFIDLQNKCNVSYSGEYGEKDLEILTGALNYWRDNIDKSKNSKKHKILVFRSGAIV